MQYCVKMSSNRYKYIHVLFEPSPGRVMSRFSTFGEILRDSMRYGEIWQDLMRFYEIFGDTMKYCSKYGRSAI